MQRRKGFFSLWVFGFFFIFATAFFIMHNVSAENETIVSSADNSALSLKIKSSFLADDDLKNSQLTIMTLNGALKITGTVDNEYQKHRALEIAKSICGDVMIIDQIEVNDREE